MWFAVAERLRSCNLPALVVLCSALLGSGTASALSVGLDTELDTGISGPFVAVDIVENDGGLNFSISLNLDELGADADLHMFYFNFVGSHDGLSITSTDPQKKTYTLSSDPRVFGGAGSSFDWGVHFGNGGGPNGNGRLAIASFTLTAFGDLSVSHLLGSSWAKGDTIHLQMAAHIQETRLTRETSETIGGVIPEPSTAILLVSGLVLLAGQRRRFNRLHAFPSKALIYFDPPLIY